ncbi:MAG: TIR domain-containing protein, partial [Pseudomonadota bacterium]
MALQSWLIENGWDDLFLDLDPERGLRAGERWQDALKTASARCEAVLFLISPAWVASKWCLAEFLLAKQMNKRIFGVVIAETAFDDLPTEMSAEWQLVVLTAGVRDRTFSVVQQSGAASVDVVWSTDALTRLKRGLENAGLSADSFDLQPDPNGSFGWRAPYRGLQALEAADAAVFFGREADIVRGMDQLRGLADGAPPRLMVILGASGAGKSSFLRAVLWPRLERDDASWAVLDPVRHGAGGAIEGGEGLLAALAGIHERFGEPVNLADLRPTLENGETFTQALGDIRQKAARRALLTEDARPPICVLPIDQAEELFAAKAGPEAARLLELARAGLDSGDLLVAATIRSDAYGAMQSASEWEGVNQHTFSLRPAPSGEIGRI